MESSNLGIGRLEADRGKKEQIFSQNKRTQDDKRANITGKGRQNRKKSKLGIMKIFIVYLGRWQLIDGRELGIMELDKIIST